MKETLHTLSKNSGSTKRRKRLGRGIGSGTGKTCGRGEKGAGSRAGYKRRLGYEGGQFRLFMKLPIRGFTRGRFKEPALDVINLKMIDAIYEDGERVSRETLIEKGYISTQSPGIKVLGDGELKKKLEIDAKAFSKSAEEKLKSANIPFKKLGA